MYGTLQNHIRLTHFKHPLNIHGPSVSCQSIERRLPVSHLKLKGLNTIEANTFLISYLNQSSVFGFNKDCNQHPIE